MIREWKGGGKKNLKDDAQNRSEDSTTPHENLVTDPGVNEAAEWVNHSLDPPPPPRPSPWVLSAAFQDS